MGVHDEHKEHDDHSGHWRIVVGGLLIFVILGALAALSSLIWKFLLPSSSHMLTVVLSDISGFFLFGVCVWTFSAIRRIAKKNEIMDAHQSLLDAIDQVAQGNFNVLIEYSDHSPHSDIAGAFNKMAKDLDSLETMRQDFISNVSHEIQSPLTSIGGFAAIIKKDSLTPEERCHYAEIIESETKRLSSLSDNLLKLSSLDGEQRPLSLKEFRMDKQLQRIALATEPQWSLKNINLEADLQPCEFTGDEDLLSQIWINLLHNAIKFTPEGGGINISLSTGEKEVIVTISDTGFGIAPEDQMHIFERFYKADKARDRSLGGNGLGLALCKRIAELHGGNITVKSQIGGGSAFSVRLPV
ncbi:MAG: HAMP domain-containing histidine kinase [Oscillospiraceae bacterium]|jgi:signal transduction histidine kinase|nr:HAMP domain-containing histidine kinase [Oscillospiraceae bacterium]